MSNFITAERIEQFSNLMNPYVSEEFKEWLIENRFFTAPASIHHHGAYSGALFDHSFAVTKALLSFTERLELKWQLERSPYIVGMFHDLCYVTFMVFLQRVPQQLYTQERTVNRYE